MLIIGLYKTVAQELQQQVEVKVMQHAEKVLKKL